MLISAKDVQGFTIHSLDNEDFGSAQQFYFDDERWTVRYFVLDTRKWLPGKSVLLSPISIKEYKSKEKAVYVDLTKDRIMNSPDIDTQLPISRQQESEYSRYFGFPFYWGGTGIWGNAMYPVGMTAPIVTDPNLEDDEPQSFSSKKEKQAERNSHLRSTNEVIDYRIQAIDGDIGHVSDFIIDDDTWEIAYLVVDTGTLWPGKKILLSPKWIEEIRWDEKCVRVSLDVDSIKNGPDYDPTKEITKEYESTLYEMYKKNVHYTPK